MCKVEGKVNIKVKFMKALIRNCSTIWAEYFKEINIETLRTAVKSRNS